MSLMRFVARSLFASYFIADGVKAIRRPAEAAPDAERVTSKIAPLVQRLVPADVASYVPERAETWVRVVGAVQIAGGVMFATGLGRRIGALLLAKSSAINLAIAWPEKDAAPAVKEAARGEAMRQAALLGAAALATLDTQGKPSLKWRADQAVKETKKKAEEQAAAASKAAKSATR
ncbi:MAG: DoxX family membrane protein [Arachnia sp.]